MKKSLTLSLLLALFFSSRITDAQSLSSKKILIVYLSRTNNTKILAEIIHKQIGGILIALEIEKPYPQNYQAMVQQVVHENEKGFLPPLKTKIDRIQQYDVVFVGFPTWGMQLPPPMKSFLHQYDLKGKTVIPFNSNGGYGMASCNCSPGHRKTCCWRDTLNLSGISGSCFKRPCSASNFALWKAIPYRLSNAISNSRKPFPESSNMSRKNTWPPTWNHPRIPQ